MHHNGQLGVCLCPYGEGHILVVQDSHTPEPPRDAHRVLRMGHGLPEVGHTVQLGRLRVSCMRVRPLDNGCTAPPPALTSELREFCARRNASGERECGIAESSAFWSCHAKDVFGETEGRCHRDFLSLALHAQRVAREELAVVSEVILS